ncbi:unnamed protein product [Arabidopsis arenosa]|uniref:SWIM-type domain-containing protein n=1 Tax=Arabidopsis arenosa TaxID=38785 RepID=A0A8S2A8A7_ARAAE|nr:unnamed protein product [Arabidopsis arenosa]
MEVTDELITDMVRVKLGGWSKDEQGVRRFAGTEGQMGRYIRFREGDGVEAAKTKVIEEFSINTSMEKIELTYEMPEWMDVDGSVKPVPIHIVSDDDMDMFLAMRVDINEMKLFVVPMALNMTLEIDGLKVVPLMDEFAFGEVMSKEELEKEKRQRLDKEVGDNIICSQVQREHVGDSNDGPLGWIGNSYASSGFATLSAALRHYRTVTVAPQHQGSPVSVLEPQSSSSTDDIRVTRLTRDLFSDFERAADGSSGDIGDNSEQQNGAATQSEVPERINGRVFKNRDDCRVKIAVHAINRKFSYRNHRTTNDVVIVRCVSDACPWRVYCLRLDESEYFEIRTAHLEHTCPVETRSQYPRQATTSVISQIMKSKYAGSGARPTPVAIRRALMEEYSVNVSYWKAWRSRELAMDLAKGSPNGSYGILPSYLHMLSRANVGTVTDLHTEVDIDGDNRNVATKFKKRMLAGLISKAARAYRKTTFYEFFEEIERASPGCAEYLMVIGLEHWTRSHCYGQRYNIMTSNVAESLNAVLKEARELPIVTTLEYIRGTLMTWFEKRREKATQHEKPLTPKVEEIVQRDYERSTCYDVAKINNEQYEIKTTTGLSYVVDIQKRTCTCEEFNLLQIPCSHAIAAAIRCDMSVPMLAAPQYGSFFWSLAYNGSIHPVPNLSTLREVPDGIATLTVLPPLTRRPPGQQLTTGSEGGSSSTVQEFGNEMTAEGYECDCGKQTLIFQAWTDANPGRRFYRCGAGWRSECNHFRWIDLEKPHGWQKQALLEARDLIKAQDAELKRLRESQAEGIENYAGEVSIEYQKKMEDLEKEKNALESDLKASKEKEQTIREVLLISWIGFICVFATVVHALK